MNTKLILSTVGVFLIAGLFAVAPGAVAEQLAGHDGSSLRTIELPGTSTIIIARDSGTSAATKGEAFFCEGEKPNNYNCSNSYASYGCSEDCKCCYYEEKMVGEQDVNTALHLPRGQ